MNEQKLIVDTLSKLQGVVEKILASALGGAFSSFRQPEPDIQVELSAPRNKEGGVIVDKVQFDIALSYMIVDTNSNRCTEIVVQLSLSGNELFGQTKDRANFLQLNARKKGAEEAFLSIVVKCDDTHAKGRWERHHFEARRLGFCVDKLEELWHDIVVDFRKFLEEKSGSE